MARTKSKRWISKLKPRRHKPGGGTIAELKRYNKTINWLELFAIPLGICTFVLAGASKLWSILSTPLWMTFSIMGFIASFLLVLATIFRYKRWNGYQKGFLGLIVPIIYLICIWIILFHISWPYLMAAKQFHMYG